MTRWTTLSESEIAEKSARNRAARTAGPRKVSEELEKAFKSLLPKTVAADARRQSRKRATVPKRGKSGRSKPVPTEHEEQVRVIDFWRVYAAAHKIPECLLFAIPNGANKSMASAAKFKREGLRKGVPDLFLAIPRPPWYGLFIEMKRTKGSAASSEQLEMLNTLSVQSYDTELCYGADEAIAAITRYLEG